MCRINTLLDTLEQSAPLWVSLTMTHIHKDAVTLKKAAFLTPWSIKTTNGTYYCQKINNF